MSNREQGQKFYLLPDNGLSSVSLTLNSNQVHVWRASLDMDVCSIASLHQTLSADEQQRAARFYFQNDQQHFTAARGLLRAILSRYLDKAPSDLSFCYNAHGKPSLITADGEDTVNFNVSHSQGLALYAVTRDRNIGIDIERIRTNIACEEIAQRFFSPRETSVLRSLSANIKHKAFFNCWTRKEAYIKATGKGLAIPLNQFEVSLIPGEPAALLSIKGDINAARNWSLYNLNPSPDYAAALAIQADDLNSQQLMLFSAN